MVWEVVYVFYGSTQQNCSTRRVTESLKFSYIQHLYRNEEIDNGKSNIFPGWTCSVKIYIKLHQHESFFGRLICRTVISYSEEQKNNSDICPSASTKHFTTHWVWVPHGTAFWYITLCVLVELNQNFLLAACFIHISCMAYSSTLKMETACSS
jgi:hypothetical protein